jgi:hypothetical protein
VRAIPALGAARSPVQLRRAAAAAFLAYLSLGCEPELVVGAWACPAPAPSSDGGAVAYADKVVEAPWSTSFELDWCDYTRAAGFCYSAPAATYDIVETPVHTGRRAAAFSVIGDPAANAGQARCFREGVLPANAQYGAWFYVPSSANNTGNWNLMHFQGGVPPDFHGLWDVSLGSNDDGSLYLYLFDFLGPGVRRPTDTSALPVPIGAWFHVELRLRRAADTTGEVVVYLDGAPVLGFAGIVTDDTTSAQWYVGNLANALDPPASTIYVDDVTVDPL